MCALRLYTIQHVYNGKHTIDEILIFFLCVRPFRPHITVFVRLDFPLVYADPVENPRHLSRHSNGLPRGLFPLASSCGTVFTEVSGFLRT